MSEPLTQIQPTPADQRAGTAVPNADADRGNGDGADEATVGAGDAKVEKVGVAQERGNGEGAEVSASVNPGPAVPLGVRVYRPVDKAVRDRIEAAMAIIDAGTPADGRGNDYILQPQEHAKIYESSAPDLAERLQISDLRVTAESYAERDAEANALRAQYEKKSARARNAVLVSAIAAALLVASAGAAGIAETVLGAKDGASRIADLKPVLDGAVIFLSLLAVVAGALAAGWIQAVRGGALLERWMKRRAEAETERLRYFALLTEQTRLENPLLQLEYFRRYQLDVQRAYFRARGDDHRRGADHQVMVTAMATAAAAIATGVAGVLGASYGAAWTSVAALGLVAQAFSGRAENRQASQQSVRNAERYEQTRASLNEFYRLLDQVRVATATAGPGDDLALMRQYVAAVHDRLAVEHRQWLDDTKLASEALARLETMIEDSKRKVKER